MSTPSLKPSAQNNNYPTSDAVYNSSHAVLITINPMSSVFTCHARTPVKQAQKCVFFICLTHGERAAPYPPPCAIAPPPHPHTKGVLFCAGFATVATRSPSGLALYFM